MDGVFGAQEVNFDLEAPLHDYFPGDDGFGSINSGNGWTKNYYTSGGSEYQANVLNLTPDVVNQNGVKLKAAVSIVKTGIFVGNLIGMNFDLSNVGTFLTFDDHEGTQTEYGVSSIINTISSNGKSDMRIINRISDNDQSTQVTYRFGNQQKTFQFTQETGAKTIKYKSYPLGTNMFALIKETGASKEVETYKVLQDGNLSKMQIINDTTFLHNKDGSKHMLGNNIDQIKSYGTNLVISKLNHQGFFVSGLDGKMIEVNSGAGSIPASRLDGISYGETVIPIGGDSIYTLLEQNPKKPGEINLIFFDAEQTSEGKVSPISTLNLGSNVSKIDSFQPFKKFSNNSTPTDIISVQYTTEKGQRLLKIFEVTDEGKQVSEGVSIIKPGVDVDSISIVNGESIITFKDGSPTKVKMFVPKK